MKTIELKNVQLRICATREEFIEEAKTHQLAPSVKRDLEEMQMLYLYHTPERLRDIFLVVETDDTKTLISNITRVLNSHQLDEAVGAAEDGNILSDEETDHMAFDFASDLCKLLDALGV